MGAGRRRRDRRDRGENSRLSRSSTSSPHIFMPEGIFFMSMPPGRAPAGPLRADALHVERDLHLAGLFEFERDRQLVALLERALEIQQHQMIAARRELDRLAGLDGETLVERAHRHHAIVHGHFVDLDLAGDVGRARRSADPASCPCSRWSDIRRRSWRRPAWRGSRPA